MWHVTVPITDKHQFLAILRRLVLDQYSDIPPNKQEYQKAIRVWLTAHGYLPSAYLFTTRRWFRTYVIPTKLGWYYVEWVSNTTKKLEQDKCRFHWDAKRNTRPHFEERYIEAVPALLSNYGFASRADYLVKWSMFHGQLAREGVLFEFKTLSIFDSLSDGIKTREEEDKLILEQI